MQKQILDIYNIYVNTALKLIKNFIRVLQKPNLQNPVLYSLQCLGRFQYPFL